MFKCGLESRTAYINVFNTISCGLQSSTANNRINTATSARPWHHLMWRRFLFRADKFSDLEFQYRTFGPRSLFGFFEKFPWYKVWTTSYSQRYRLHHRQSYATFQLSMDDIACIWKHSVMSDYVGNCFVGWRQTTSRRYGVEQNCYRPRPSPYRSWTRKWILHQSGFENQPRKSKRNGKCFKLY